jgi:outer membrane lipoprotein-sorting protein
MQTHAKEALMRLLLFLAAFAVLFGIRAYAEDPPFIKDGKVDVDAVVAHFEDLYRADSSEADVELIITKPRRTRTMRMRIWTRGKEHALIVVTAPPREKDTATLKVERNLWNYLPRIRRTIRIPPSMMLASWMGSDFTNDDLVREASFIEDYRYEFQGETNNPEGWLIRFDAKPDVPGLWSRFDLVVDKQNLLPVRAEYFDRRGDSARTLHWRDIKTLGTRKIPAHMTLIPKDKPNQKTEMIYHSLDFDADVPEHMFSLSELERKR